MRTSGRVIMPKSEWIKEGKRRILSKCCWAVNNGESVILSLTECPQNKSSCKTSLDVPVAFTDCGLLGWVTSASLHVFLLVSISSTVNRMSSKNQLLERFHFLCTGQSDCYRQPYGELQHLTSNAPFLSQKHKTRRIDAETQTYFLRSHTGNRAPKRKWCKTIIISRHANRTPYHSEIFKEYFCVHHKLACFFNC